MARLIDADALKERAIRVSTVKEHCYFKAVGTREIDKAPTIDAVCVVRCKDCKWYLPKSRSAFVHCTVSGIQTVEDDFCSYGERRTDEDNS